jgi:glutathione synthase/RimK-type ligase-like ATP-grasp enzyme
MNSSSNSESKPIRIGIHARENSFSERWISYCTNNNISFKIIDCHSLNVIEEIKKENITIVMWHLNHASSKEQTIAPYLLNCLEEMGISVFPNYATRQHFNDKIAQYTKMIAINAPMIPTYIYFDENEAKNALKSFEFPIVSKLKGGAGSTSVKLIKSKKEAQQLIEKMFNEGVGATPKLMENLDQKLRLTKKIKNPLRLISKIKKHLKDVKTEQKTKAVERNYVLFQKFLTKNDFDTRIIVVGDKAFGIRRWNKKNDFRASGSGLIDSDPTNIDTKLIQLAFNVNEKLKMQSVAFDFIYDESQDPKIIEFCFGFSMEAYNICPGYWKKNGEYIEDKFNPQGWMIQHLIEK